MKGKTRTKRYMASTLFCRYCGNEFVGKSSKLFCSRSCKDSHFEEKYVHHNFGLFKTTKKPKVRSLG